MTIIRKKSGKKGNFWAKLHRPFFVIAPMANVTDSVFRGLFAKYGKPDVMWTEFVSADGLASAGKKNLLKDLKYSEKERPIVTQLFTGHPEEMKIAAKIVADLGFDGLDINMGCPDKAVVRQGGGSALIKDPVQAIRVLQAAREGVKHKNPPPPYGRHPLFQRGNPASDSPFEKGGARRAGDFPVSIKTRLGYGKIDLDWIKLLLEQRLPALTIHLRTKKEMSDVSAHWEIMPEIIKLRDEISPETLIIGNGDIESLEQAKAFAIKYGCDGVMIGRGIFGKPWFFNQASFVAKETRGKQISNIEYQISDHVTPKDRLKILVEHTKLFEKTFKNVKSFDIMKKHFKAYVSGWDGAKELRIKLFEAKNAKGVDKIIKEYLNLRAANDGV